MNSVILRTAARVLLPLLAIFSVILLLRGHNLPGGGFVGGLLVASAVVLYAMAEGPRKARALLRIDLQVLIGIGLLMGLAAGLIGVIAGRPFMAGLWAEVLVPGLGVLKVGTPLLFDVGVYITVLATCLHMILTLAEEA